MSLLAFQRHMMEDVLRPLTEDESMQARCADGSSVSDRAAAYIKPNRHLTAFERLEIYNRQYWLRVMDALAEDFPALQAVIGHDRFEELSREYLAAHPSRSFTLRNLGSCLPAWLAEHRKHLGDRADLSVDVARLEWAYAEAFDLAEMPPISAQEIAHLDTDAPLALQPYLRLLELQNPVDDLVLKLHQERRSGTAPKPSGEQTSHIEDEKIPEIQPCVTWLAVHRHDLSVYYKRLACEEYKMLKALAKGLSLGTALEAAFLHTEFSPDEQSVQVGAWFSNWSELGWLCSSLRSGAAFPERNS
jgi:hypothetical protein